jgi:Arylsulfotransferase (ASST)
MGISGQSPESGGQESAGHVSRRRAFGIAGASAAGAAGLVVGARSVAQIDRPRPPRAGSARHPEFISRPDLKPPPISVTRYGQIAPDRYIFLNSPYSGPGAGGAVILDHTGELVYFGPNSVSEHKQDVNAQLLDGEPVLTWWRGRIVAGHGEGAVVIADSSYQVKRVLYAHNGLKADLHEFNVTPQGTALISAWRTHSGVDLSAVGGPKDGYLFSGVFQEIDIATGNLVFEWDSYTSDNSHVPVAETHMTLGRQGHASYPFDYFHINSICPTADGNFLVSGRHTWTVYKVSRADGSIMWRLNGKRSDFSMGPGSPFMWQHHVRPYGSSGLTIFDNGAASLGLPRETQSRALILDVDEAAKKATLVRAVTHPGARVLARGLGSVEMLPGAEMLVGWGDACRFSQFGADGKMLLDARMDPTGPTYRAFSQAWTGRPAEPPALAARSRSGGATVYASWNGATEVASWAVFAGQRDRLSKIATARRTGFETAIEVPASGPYFAVQAHDASGQALARSEVARIA